MPFPLDQQNLCVAKVNVVRTRTKYVHWNISQGLIRPEGLKHNLMTFFYL